MAKTIAEVITEEIEDWKEYQHITDSVRLGGALYALRMLAGALKRADLIAPSEKFAIDRLT